MPVASEIGVSPDYSPAILAPRQGQGSRHLRPREARNGGKCGSRIHLWGILGLVFSVGSLWIVSQLSGVVRLLNEPAEIAQAAPEGIEGDIAGDDDQSGNLAADVPPATDGSRQTGALTSATAGSSPQADTSSAAKPQTGTAGDLVATPNADDQIDTTQPAAETSIVTAQATQLSTPSSDQVPLGEQAPAPAVQPTPQVDTPQTGGDDAAAAAPATEGSAPQTGDGTTSPEAPADENTPDVDEAAPAGVQTSDAPSVDDSTGADLADSGTSALTPVTRIEDQAENVTVNRLPTVTTDDAADPDTAAADTAEEVEFPPGTPALVRYGREYSNDAGTPTMAIVLLTGPDGQLGAALPVAVSYAIDASAENAAALMQAARAAGQEVLAVAPLPTGARASDVSVAMANYLDRLNESVAVMDVPEAGFQASREVAAQVIADAGADGRGMITYSRGLNSALQMAEREGVPALLVFRVFDGEGQDRAAIKRFLDQAAFRARQQSGVIMVGHDRPETVAAILEWLLGNRASTVSLAPISAVLGGG